MLTALSNLWTAPAAKAWTCSTVFHIAAFTSLAVLQLRARHETTVVFGSSRVNAVTLVVPRVDRSATRMKLVEKPMAAPVAAEFPIERHDVRRHEQVPDFVPETPLRTQQRPRTAGERSTWRDDEPLIELQPTRLARARTSRTLQQLQTSVAVSEESSQTKLPEFEENRPPVYPRQAARRGWQGTVILRIRIATNGSVVRVDLLQSSGYTILDNAAIQAVKAWRAKPSRHDGGFPRAVRLPVRFDLSR